MARVNGSDLRRVFRFLEAGAAGTPDDPLPLPTLIGLRDLIGADEAGYFELRRADRAVLAYTTTSETEPEPGTEEMMLAFGHQNPLNWRRWHPADGSMRLSGVIRRRDFERREFFNWFMKPNHVRDTLKVWLWSSAESAACVALDRSEGDFSRRDQDVLGILQHHLIEWRERALAGRVAPGVDGVWLTPREAEVMTWAARGSSNDEIAAMLGTSPATIGKHLEHAYEKLGVHSRAEALWRLTTPTTEH